MTGEVTRFLVVIPCLTSAWSFLFDMAIIPIAVMAALLAVMAQRQKRGRG